MRKGDVTPFDFNGGRQTRRPHEGEEFRTRKDSWNQLSGGKRKEGSVAKINSLRPQKKMKEEIKAQ